MTIPATPLVCSSSSFMVDPALTDAVDIEYTKTPLHSPTADPNRYTIHVPTETTRLSLGQKSSRWNTDIGITGYTDSHVHFETKENDKTIVSLGTPATTTAIPGHDPKVSSQSDGYSMVTEKNAWHEATLQHHLLSRAEDMSLRTMGGGKRAVLQADHGKVDFNGGKQVNVSGGGISIAAGELEVESKGYEEEWEGARPHSSAAGGASIGAAILAALSAVGDVVINKPRLKYGEGDFAGAPEEAADKHKRKINMALLLAAMNKVRSLISTPTSPPKCVKLDAPETISAMAGRDLGIFGTMGANLGSALWSSVTSGVSASLSSTVFAGVGGMFASMKGYRKVEIGSDWGKVFIGAEKEIHLEGEKSFTAGADNVAHVAAPGGEGSVLLGGGKKVWMGTTAGGGWGLLLDDEGLALGAASGAGEMKTAKIKDATSLRVVDTRIEFKTKAAWMKLAGDTCTIATKDKKIRFEATSGPVTINGAKILLK
ncbi:MAG: hypothetical protein ABJE95_13855 [Byssovorax sp.]